MDAQQKRKKLLSGISLGIVLLLMALLTVFFWRWLKGFTLEGLREYIQSFGAGAALVFLFLQFLQVFIALIPGELLETVAGFAFAPLWGTALCYIGIALASTAVFLLTRRYGVKLTELFVSREKISRLRFLRTEKKRNTLLFLLFFVPGTPKDLLTYFVGLTDIRLTEFLLISLIARLPSVVSSTFGGHLLAEENYTGAIVLYAVTAAVSFLGILGYNRFVNRKGH